MLPGTVGLEDRPGVSCQVHQDEGCLLVGYVQRLGVSGRLSPADIILDFPIVQSRDEPLDEEDLIPHVRVWVRQVITIPSCGCVASARTHSAVGPHMQIGPSTAGSR